MNANAEAANIKTPQGEPASHQLSINTYQQREPAEFGATPSTLPLKKDRLDDSILFRKTREQRPLHRLSQMVCRRKSRSGRRIHDIERRTRLRPAP